MPVIELATLICAPRERVFDLARSSAAHRDSTGGPEERGVAGVTRGLVGKGDEVTWEARHFGMRQRLAVRITAFDRPSRLREATLSGAFERMVHDRQFAGHSERTAMHDRFASQSPLGLLDALPDWLLLTSYLRRFLTVATGRSGAWRSPPNGGGGLNPARSQAAAPTGLWSSSSFSNLFCRLQPCLHWASSRSRSAVGGGPGAGHRRGTPYHPHGRTSERLLRA